MSTGWQKNSHHNSTQIKLKLTLDFTLRRLIFRTYRVLKTICFIEVQMYKIVSKLLKTIAMFWKVSNRVIGQRLLAHNQISKAKLKNSAATKQT